MRTIVIVQARMGSTRLPGKVMLPLSGRPILGRLLERLGRVSLADGVVVATTTSLADDAIEVYCRNNGVNYYRGSENDVLFRYFETAKSFDAKLVVRVTSDCPLLDPQIVDTAIAEFGRGDNDYLSNMIPPTFPYGMAVEVFTMDSLARAHNEATQAAEREHVTPYLYWNPSKFRLKAISMVPDLSHHRWTVDTLQDYELVKRLFEALYPANVHFTMDDILSLLQEHPEWSDINRGIEQFEPKSDARG